MNPIFIYQNEAKLDNNSKFTIDFIDEEVVNLVIFFFQKIRIIFQV